MERPPRFSVVIPCWNEAANLSQCLAGIRAAAGERHTVEVILADNGSTDGSLELARGLGVRVLANGAPQRVAIAALRNKGAAASQGEILCFLDADMRVPATWLDMVEQHYRTGARGMLGFVETTPTKGLDGEPFSAAPWVARVWGERYRLRRPGVRAVDFLPGRNMNIPRDAFQQLGGMDESLLTSEDKDLTLRAVDAGLGAVSSDEAVLVHTGYEKSLGEFLRKEFWRQGGSLAFARKHRFRCRVLRQPLMAAGHLWCMVLMAACLLGLGTAQGMAWLALAWATPSIVTTWAGPARRKPWLALQLTALVFLRWNVAAYALAWQLLREFDPRKQSPRARQA